MSLGKAVVLGLMLSLSPAADSVGLAGRDGEPGNLNYLALGASDAAGIGAFPLTRGYVFKIADALAVRGEPVGLYNLGIPGATVIEIQAALEIFLITRQQIDLVTIWVGSNDLIQGLAISEFAQGLHSVLSQLRARTNAFIVIANLVDLTRLPRFVEKPDADVTVARVAAFNQIIRNEAARFRIAVLNLFALVDPNRGAITASDILGCGRATIWTSSFHVSGWMIASPSSRAWALAVIGRGNWPTLFIGGIICTWSWA